MSDAMVTRANPAPTRLTPAAFADRFQQASRTLWCIAAGACGDRTLADDLVQDAAMIALQKLDDFDPATNFTAWMARIVRNLALNAVRRTARRRTSPASETLDYTEGPDQAHSPADAGPVDSRGRLVTDQTAFDDGVAQALADLEETARSCLLLRTVMGLPYDEIAAALGIPPGTAMSHVHRARKAMRIRLDETLQESRHTEPHTDARGKGASDA